MMAIGSYFAFIIFVTGTMSTARISDEERKRFFQDILTQHNQFRKWHYAQPLILDQEICDLIKAHTDRLEANEKTEIPTGYGINIFTVRFDDKPVLDAKFVVYFWYNEAGGYDYSIEPEAPSKEIDAFTQLVWNSTTHIGVGMWIKDNVFHVVVAYSPPGNQKQEYLENVLRPRTTLNADD